MQMVEKKGRRHELEDLITQMQEKRDCDEAVR